MSEFPLGYERIALTTWCYLSSLLMIGLFFKFNRIPSVRNIDLILLVLLAPGLVLVVNGSNQAAVSTESSAVDELARTIDQPASDPPSVDSNDAPSVESLVEDAARLDAAADPTADQSDVAPALPNLGVANNPGERGPENALTEDETSSVATAESVPSRSTEGRVMQKLGFIWLFVVGILLVARMLLDPMMTRRPLLEPNLSTGGLTWIGCSLFVFLMANVITSRPTRDDLEGPRSAEQLVSGVADEQDDDRLSRHGPGYALIFMLPSIPTVAMSNSNDVPPISSIRTWSIKESEDGRPRNVDAEYLGKGSDETLTLRLAGGGLHSTTLEALSEVDRVYLRTMNIRTVIAKVIAILAHLAIVIGIVVIGHFHFDNLKMGIGAATLYLMLPYTAQMTGRVDHVIPAALLVWAVFFYRQPLAAGMFIGLASGVVYYPLFLLPLWISFYWQRGLVRFVIGVLSMLGILALSLIFVSADATDFMTNIQKMFGIWLPLHAGLQGIWGLGWDPSFRLPVMVGFIALSGTFALWPAQKNLGTLLSCSTALMMATQFWHGFGGGLFMAWYLPLALLTFFRPNLEDRIALTVLGEGWLSRRRRHQLSQTGLAA